MIYSAHCTEDENNENRVYQTVVPETEQKFSMTTTKTKADDLAGGNEILCTRQFSSRSTQTCNNCAVC